MDVAATKDVTFKGKLNNPGITCMCVYCRSCQRHLPDVKIEIQKGLSSPEMLFGKGIVTRSGLRVKFPQKIKVKMMILKTILAIVCL